MPLQQNAASVWLRFGGRKRLERDLREVAADDKDVSVVLTLIKMGAAPDGRDPETGHIPLMVAVDYGCRAIVVALLSHEADINLRANNDKSALDLAREKGRAEIERLLLEGHQANQEYQPPGATEP